jgi:hypothetical protein
MPPLLARIEDVKRWLQMDLDDHTPDGDIAEFLQTASAWVATRVGRKFLPAPDEDEVVTATYYQVANGSIIDLGDDTTVDQVRVWDGPNAQPRVLDVSRYWAANNRVHLVPWQWVGDPRYDAPGYIPMREFWRVEVDHIPTGFIDPRIRDATALKAAKWYILAPETLKSATLATAGPVTSANIGGFSYSVSASGITRATFTEDGESIETAIEDLLSGMGRTRASAV